MSRLQRNQSKFKQKRSRKAPKQPRCPHSRAKHGHQLCKMDFQAAINTKTLPSAEIPRSPPPSQRQHGPSRID